MNPTENNAFIENLIRRITESLRKLFSQIRQKYLAFLFFIVLSTVAWFLRALSDEYIANIEYPVKYINLPPNRILSQPPPEKLTLQVQSDGYTILSSRFKYKRPLSYNVNAFALYSLSEDSTSVYTLTWYAKDRLSTELSLSNKNIQILDIKPDTLIFNFTRVKKKKVPVTGRLQKTNDLFEKQYMLNGIPFSDPDSIEVIGPSYIIDTLRSVYTENLKFKNLSDTAIKRAQLIKINKLNCPIKKVKVIVPVDEFTESDFIIPINPVNVPDSLTIKTFPKNVRVKFIVTLSHFDQVTIDQFHAYVDFSSVDENISSEATKLRIYLDSIPPFVHNLNLSPRNVEFLIEKKNVKTGNNRGNR